MVEDHKQDNIANKIWNPFWIGQLRFRLSYVQCHHANLRHTLAPIKYIEFETYTKFRSNNKRTTKRKNINTHINNRLAKQKKKKNEWYCRIKKIQHLYLLFLSASESKLLLHQISSAVLLKYSIFIDSLKIQQNKLLFSFSFFVVAFIIFCVHKQLCYGFICLFVCLHRNDLDIANSYLEKKNCMEYVHFIVSSFQQIIDDAQHWRYSTARCQNRYPCKIFDLIQFKIAFCVGNFQIMGQW